jgi:hypothetical protein
MSARLHRLLHRRGTKLLVTLAVALVVAAGAGAWWTGGSSGTGSGPTGSPVPLTITAVTPTTGLLYPGGSGNVKLSISNPNAYVVRVNSLQSIGIDADHSGCDTSALVFTPQTNLGWDVPANTTVNNLTLTNAISMKPEAANDCQGAVFTIHLQTGP